MVERSVLPEDDEQEDFTRADYARAVGSRLRAVRKQMRLSLQAVEAMSDQEFKASVLGAYERGSTAISVPRLQRLAKLYDVPVDQLLPQDDDTDRWGAQGAEGEGVGNGGESPGRIRRQLRPWDGHEKVTVDLSKLNTVAGPTRSSAAFLEHDPGAAAGLQRADDHDPGRGHPRDRLPLWRYPRRHEPPPRRAGPAGQCLMSG